MKKCFCDVPMNFTKNTPQESVQDCINHFEYLQKTYNKENISI